MMHLLSTFRISLTLVLSVITGSIHAQNIEEIKTWSVEEFAQKMTDQMTLRVPLDSAQVSMVHRINQKFAEQSMPILKGTDDPKKKVAVIKEFDKQRSGELEVFLGAEQMRQVRQIQAENRRKMKQRYYEKNL